MLFVQDISEQATGNCKTHQVNNGSIVYVPMRGFSLQMFTVMPFFSQVSEAIYTRTVDHDSRSYFCVKCYYHNW